MVHIIISKSSILYIQRHEAKMNMQSRQHYRGDDTSKKRVGEQEKQHPPTPKTVQKSTSTLQAHTEAVNSI